ncbi:MAG: M23 family metallopeptidase [Gemmatimonadota bacterium]|nr:M23 family metallopeptidase [Gemmatimonadota bacterium]
MRVSKTAILLLGGGLLVVAAAVFRHDSSSPAPKPPSPLLAMQPLPVVAWRERVDTLHRGETLTALLARDGISDKAIPQLLRAARGLDPRRLPIGMSVTTRRSDGDSLPSEVVFRLAVDHRLYVRREGPQWTSEDRRLAWAFDTIAVGGVIRSNLYEALDSSSAALLPAPQRAELAWALADIYEYRVDMSRDLQPGDHFRVLFVRGRGPDAAVRIGDILASRFTLSGSATEAVRFSDHAQRAEYFDQTGKSMRASFLRAPVSFRRISSGFGMRKHPILGIWRAHKGTDYAANAGTPVRSIGDGTVVFAGHKGGYGNLLEIRHLNGFVSRYGHLRAFASGVRPGRRVSIAQTVAYVGMTGLATAPHLHFEILVKGAQRDPRVALKQTGGPPIAASERAAFEGVRSAMIAALDRGFPRAELASR